MDKKDITEYTFESLFDFFKTNIDAVIAVNFETARFHTIRKSGFFNDFIDDDGDYHELIEKLWYHFNNSDERITKDYHVFIPSLFNFTGKMSKRLKIVDQGISHVVQMTIYPIKDTPKCILLLDELDESEYEDEVQTNSKVNTIQNTYLFSMYVDLVKDVTSSISITEISDETVNTQIRYSDWRMMIVNMIWPDDQPVFLERTEPEYLKAHFAPGHTSSFDCLMQNLEGKYIWVKLILSRAETNNDDDFRFVFMVQDIHENTVELMSTLKKYEEMASMDPLTSVLNHGRIETELGNAVEIVKKNKRVVSVMMIDIDFFKKVNDTYGHSVGDMTLKRFASIISQCFSDGRAVVGRWGGEEFVTICYDTDVEKLREIAEALRTRVESENFKAVGKVTCSVGITDITEYDEAEIVFERMDKALYDAKSSGRNCVRILQA
ncbi:MAG: GGDEF domain-containing protein [Lachnospiraceae bacterium]|nr:GGDEF domain-containing protein [Lachnospiraceae bacterium]